MPFRFSKDKWLVLLAMVSGISMIFLDSTILPVALPTIQLELGISDVNLQWIVNAYFLTNASFVIFGGKLGDIFGSRRIFLFGISIFGIASACGGLAWNSLFLIGSRVLQGFGAALIAPSISAIIITKFPPNQRGKAIGISVAIGSLFLSLGPFIGGLLTEYINWRWTFFINIFITLFGIFATLKYVPIYPSKRVNIDFVSLFFFAGALLLITLGAMEGERLGWLSYRILGSFILGFIFAVIFYLYYRSHTTTVPFLDFSLFKRINFLAGNLQAFIVQFLLMNGVFWAIFFQDGMAFSPSVAGFWTFCSTAPALLTAPIAGYMADRFGVKLPVTIGFSGLTFTFICLLLFAYFNIFTLLILGLVVFGSCISQVLTPMSPFIISSAPIEKRGLVSGIYNTMRFTGATMGMAVLGSMYTSVYQNHEQTYISTYHSDITPAAKAEWIRIAKKQVTTSKEGLDVQEIRDEAKAAAYSALWSISIISLCLAVTGLLLVFAEKMKGRIVKTGVSL